MNDEGVVPDYRETERVLLGQGMREPCTSWSRGNIKPCIITGPGTTMDLCATFSKMAAVEIPTDRVVDGNRHQYCPLRESLPNKRMNDSSHILSTNRLGSVSL